MIRRALPIWLVLAACAPRPAPAAKPTAPPPASAEFCSRTEKPCASIDSPAGQAHAFLTGVDQQLRALTVASNEADWTRSTDLTDEHEQRSAEATEVLMAYLSEAIRAVPRYRELGVLSASDHRMLELLARSTNLPAPQDSAQREELAALATRMESLYGKGKWCHHGRCDNLDTLEDVLAQSRDEPTLRAAWEGWHAVGQEIEPLYARYVQLANAGARSIGYRNLGELWRSHYDMSPRMFQADLDRLWDEVSPLYEQLHCYARGKLSARYGKSKVPEQGPIPAHLLGNMWAQDWGNLYRELEPYPGLGELDVTEALKKQGYDAERMVRLGESFFTSLGFAPLPATFWQRSMLTRPEGREVVCHASAWDVHCDNDVRIKMCTKISQDDLITIHHELGHIFYFSQYYRLPMLFQDGANDGFHEAIGDAIALSVTPAYLQRVGLLKSVPEGDKGAINVLMQRALDKIAFLPFGKLVDTWRWKVFAGEIAPEQYNASWWELRMKVQGVAPPSARGEAFFDAGAKYHVAANVPYARYFLATVLQYQFHRAMCRLAGHKGPLHGCSVYGSKLAGAKLREMLALGATKPWPDALETLTGERKLDATAILDYFAPLMTWLKQQNQGRQCGW